MKKLVVTRADDNIKYMCDITHPVLINYANKCSADFKIISDNKGLHPHFRILQLYELFEEYDRILCIDSDVLIKKDCPDLFGIVPQHLIASIYEDKGSRKEDRRNRIKKIQREREDVGWRKGYINSGVIIFSSLHRDIFKKENLYLDLGYDDVLLKYRMHKNGYEVFELPYKFNHMSMFSEEWNGYASRFDSYIIHYAGNGFYPQIDRTEQIRQDYLVLNKYGNI
jgi:lipopolysaccharide biosynthesis glycosyltransferase